MRLFSDTDFARLSTPPNPRRVLPRVVLRGSRKAADRQRPVALADTALLARLGREANAAEAVATYLALRQALLPRSVFAAIVMGVARARSSCPVGRRGILTRAQAMRVATCWLQRAPSERRRLRRLLDATGPGRGRSDPLTEQALLLKAMAANPDPARLVAFARAIRHQPRRELIRLTTLLDLDHAAQTGHLNTLALLDERPTQAIGADRSKRNDGLMQIYDASCGVASAEVLIGEVDPVYALAVHTQGGAQNAVGYGLSEAMQRTWLHYFRDVPRGRLGSYAYARLQHLTQRLVRSNRITANERNALLRYCAGTSTGLSRSAQRALAAVRRAHRYPDDATLELMRRARPQQSSQGTDAEQLGIVLERTLGGYGVRFTCHEARAAVLLRDHVDALLRGLRVGDGAILGTDDHWWAIVDAERKQRGHRFLLHDPYTGITDWVTARALASGQFARQTFHWKVRAVPDTLLISNDTRRP